MTTHPPTAIPQRRRRLRAMTATPTTTITPASHHTSSSTPSRCISVCPMTGHAGSSTAPPWTATALDSAHSDLSAHNSECACGRPEECDSVLAAADKLPLPTGRELIALLVDALP